MWLFKDVALLHGILYYDKLPSFETIVNAFKVAGTSSVFLLADKYHIYQFWNKEYVQCLAEKIKNLINGKLAVEVCAGDGMLSYWLRKHRVNIVATDSGEWEIRPRNNVEIIDAVSAIKKYKPTLVIASWLPYQKEVDIQIFSQKVPYVILIGESGEGGCCGSPKFWRTKYWKKMGYIEDWEYLSECDRWNICRTDYCYKSYCSFTHSITVLYKRGTEYAFH